MAGCRTKTPGASARKTSRPFAKGHDGDGAPGVDDGWQNCRPIRILISGEARSKLFGGPMSDGAVEDVVVAVADWTPIGL